MSSPVLVGRSGPLGTLEPRWPRRLAAGVTSRGEAAAAAHRLRLFDAFPDGEA